MPLMGLLLGNYLELLWLLSVFFVSQVKREGALLLLQVLVNFHWAAFLCPFAHSFGWLCRYLLLLTDDFKDSFCV